ncbi:MAG TPA: late competence development ComFB family protein [Allocoleopsis sp.]
MGIYKNVMEMLVEEEVLRQHKALPARVASYVNPAELVAYALNQLPALYATSQQGVEYQLSRGRAKYHQQITQAVQRAVAAIGRDPLRVSSPLTEQQSPPLREVLHQMRLLLRNDKVDWDSLPNAVEHALRLASQGGVCWDANYSSRSTPSPSRRSVYGTRSIRSESNSQPLLRHPQDEPNEELFGWDDPLRKY